MCSETIVLAFRARPASSTPRHRADRAACVAGEHPAAARTRMSVPAVLSRMVAVAPLGILLERGRARALNVHATRGELFGTPLAGWARVGSVAGSPDAQGLAADPVGVGAAGAPGFHVRELAAVIGARAGKPDVVGAVAFMFSGGVPRS